MRNVLALALKGHPTMIKDLSLTGEVDSEVMGGVHGGLAAFSLGSFPGKGTPSCER